MSDDAGNIFGLSDLSNRDLLSGGALGLGALGVGSMVARGPSHSPWEFGAMLTSVPALRNEAQSDVGFGHNLADQGMQALGMAQRGELTPEQQAQLGEYHTGLTNQARQQYYNMGRNPDQDTSFIQETANVDARVNAMAQQQIQTTIQLGLGQLSAGSSFIGQGLSFSNAANQALLAAGQAQLQQDHDYSQSLTGAFTAIGRLFGLGGLFGGGGGR